MTDHIDYAADFLGGTLSRQAIDEPGLAIPADYPWVGLAMSMFDELRGRGFHVERTLIERTDENKVVWA
jgi:hypothetical protein